MLLELHFIEFVVAVEYLGSLYGERHALAYALDRLEVLDFSARSDLTVTCPRPIAWREVEGSGVWWCPLDS